MPGNFKQDDLRIIKTHRALMEALPRLLSRRKFARITVNDICQESQMSRTAFYSHFNDKYDLLRYWLDKKAPEIAAVCNDYIELEQSINGAIEANRDVITNLLDGANSELIDLIKDFIASLLVDYFGGEASEESNPFHVVLYTFCAGGISNLALWQTKNKFPTHLKMINIHIYDILEAIRQLESNKLKNDTAGEKCPS